MNLYEIRGTNTMGTNVELIVESLGVGEDQKFHIGTWPSNQPGGCFIELNRKQAKKLAKTIKKWANEQ